MTILKGSVSLKTPEIKCQQQGVQYRGLTVKWKCHLMLVVYLINYGCSEAAIQPMLAFKIEPRDDNDMLNHSNVV